MCSQIVTTIICLGPGSRICDWNWVATRGAFTGFGQSEKNGQAGNSAWPPGTLHL